ncbi:STAS domain-containing protein [Mycobacterium sp. NBC_00419]|uniref:STAS domain-containing protein n=1 Tax=Mycobacterium sp. NBC_00419 TaxID=2975989 RepID=UPI002E1B9044
MSTPLTVHTHHDADDQVVVRAAGEIDASNVAAFAEALNAGLAAADTLTVDLSGVHYLDSAAINVLVPHAESIDIVANPLLTRVLQISGLDKLTTVRTAPPAT